MRAVYDSILTLIFRQQACAELPAEPACWYDASFFSRKVPLNFTSLLEVLSI